MFFLIKKSPHPNPDAYVVYPDSHTDFEPHLWTGDEMAHMTGGYAYACNCPEMGLILPGDLITQNDIFINDRPTVDNFQFMLRCDGFHTLPPLCVPDDNSHIMALRYGRDPVTHRIECIVLRRDRNKLWSYKRHQKKMGCRRELKPRNVDFTGQPITNPETADFGSLKNFGGYASIPYAGVPMRRRYQLSGKTKPRLSTPVLTL